MLNLQSPSQREEGRAEASRDLRHVPEVKGPVSLGDRSGLSGGVGLDGPVRRQPGSARHRDLGIIPRAEVQVDVVEAAVLLVSLLHMLGAFRQLAPFLGRCGVAANA